MTRWIPICFLTLLVAAGVAAADGALAPVVTNPVVGLDSSQPTTSNPEAVTTAGLKASLNLAWILVMGFIAFFMQAGFAMVETGLTRAKNVAHTMAMNVMIYSIGALGFWACGFAFMFGNHGVMPSLSGGALLNKELTVHIAGKAFGLLGYQGFFLSGPAMDFSALALFLFYLMFLDTAATIPTGALAERWKFLAFVIYGLFVSTVLYPVYGNWVWGNGWLAKLGVNFHLGHGLVDFAGSSVVHMLGGVAALAGTIVLGPRIGKFRPDGKPNPLPAHSVPLYMLGTLMLTFGWFGFNTGSTLSASDAHVARIAVNTALSSAAGAFASMCLMWRLYRKPDPSFLCNGMLAGLVAITAPCAYVPPSSAVLIGAIAGVLVVCSVLFIERVWRLDDPVGCISVHGTCGAWGLLALGLFADGTYAPRDHFNGVAGPVAGLFHGDPSQFVAQCIGLGVNVLWVFSMAYAFFRVVDRLVGNRVSPQVELQGLDVPQLGALGYITQDPKVPEGRMIIHLPAEPRPAMVPPNGNKRFTVVVDGPDVQVLAQTWSDLCHVTEAPPPSEFKAVYPFMTTMQGNRFRFRGGDPQHIRTNLERLLQQRMKGQSVSVRVEG